jgi:CIC family chloride channel protein
MQVVGFPISSYNQMSVHKGEVLTTTRTPPRMSTFRRISTRFRNLLDRFQPSEEVMLVVTSLIVGLGTGVGAVAFRYLIQGVSWVGFTWIPKITDSLGMAYIIFIPTIGGLIVGLLIYYFAREAKGHGVPEVMEAVALKGGRIRPIVAIIKSLASSICIGSGGSVGREGPIVQIGSALGSTIGQIFHFSDDRVRNLVACGAAGGIAATFNAPIAGVIFALEIILGEISVHHLSTVVISAVSASVIGQAVFGNTPAFTLPIAYQIKTVWEFGLYPILGILAALVGVIFVRMLYWSEDVFDKWQGVPEWFKPAVGGALLGAIGLAYPAVTQIEWEGQPHIFNVGYEVISDALSNHFLIGAVAMLLILKLLATSLSLGSGGSGGIFAPSLFMGAMLGSAFGIVVHALMPEITAQAGAYTLVGMAAVFAAAAHAPITAIVILFELTGDYRIILPLMLTVVIATLLARSLLKGESIYTLKLTRRGIRLQRGQDVDVMEGILVQEVMTSQIDSVTTEMTLQQLTDTANRTRHHGFPVLDENGGLWGVVTVTDLETALAHNMSRRTTVAEIGTPRKELLVCYPDETLGVVLARMGTRGLGRIPVVHRDNPEELIGLIRREDIIRAYRLALTRRAEIQHRLKRMGMRNLDGTEFVELTLKEGDLAVGKMLTELASQLPDDCVLISLRRDGRLVIPHGDTVFNVGDHITAFTACDMTETVLQTFQEKQ